MYNQVIYHIMIDNYLIFNCLNFDKNKTQMQIIRRSKESIILFSILSVRISVF